MKTFRLVTDILIWAAVIGAAIFVLSGCTKSASEETPGVPSSTDEYNNVSGNYVGTIGGTRVFRFCDGRNLVYYNETSRSIAVVGNAQECDK